jgi:hypothetical protein
MWFEYMCCLLIKGEQVAEVLAGEQKKTLKAMGGVAQFLN